MEPGLLAVGLGRSRRTAAAVLCFFFMHGPLVQAAPLAIAGLKATLHDTVESYRTIKGAEYLRWRTDWILTWTPLTQVRYYEIRYKTSEGVSGKSRQLTEAVFTIEVAKGDNAKAAGLLARDIQLATIESLLAVSVVAHFRDGTQSPPTRWVSAGRATSMDGL